MLFKSFTASVFLIALTTSVNAQSGSAGSIVSPALGVSGNPGASDVRRPSDSTPCGDMSVSENIDTSNHVTADTNGRFTVGVTNFGLGANSSQMIQAATVDSTATGENFVSCQIDSDTNGDDKPTTESTKNVAIQLPSGIKCSGGKDKNCCLASFVTTGGSGNCVVVCQPGTTGQGSTATDGGNLKTNDPTSQTKTNPQNDDQTKANPSESDKSKNQKRVIRKRRL